MNSLDRAIRILSFDLDAAPFIPTGVTTFQVDESGGNVTARMVSRQHNLSRFQNRSDNTLAVLWASPSWIVDGAFEVTLSNAERVKGQGVGTSLYLLLTEAVQTQYGATGLTPNLTASVSSDAERLWRSLGKYGTIDTIDLDATAKQTFDDYTEMLYDPARPPGMDWDYWTNRGLNLVFRNPQPPAGYPDWKTLVLRTGGSWFGETADMAQERRHAG